MSLNFRHSLVKVRLFRWNSVTRTHRVSLDREREKYLVQRERALSTIANCARRTFAQRWLYIRGVIDLDQPFLHASFPPAPLACHSSTYALSASNVQRNATRRAQKRRRDAVERVTAANIAPLNTRGHTHFDHAVIFKWSVGRYSGIISLRHNGRIIWYRPMGIFTFSFLPNFEKSCCSLTYMGERENYDTAELAKTVSGIVLPRRAAIDRLR